MARGQRGSAVCAEAAPPSDLRGGAGAAYRTALKVLGVAQTLLLVAFAVLAQRQRAQDVAPRQAKEAPLAPQPPQPHVLTDESLLPFLAGLPGGALLSFHSPSCSHCRALAPEFAAAARELAARGGAPLASVDVAAAPEAAERYGVRRYPTLLWFRGGEPVLELPPSTRDAAKIVEYVEWASQPAVVPFGSRAELEEALPQMRAVLRPGAPPLVCGFGVKGGVHPALEAAAERLRGKTIFVFADEVQHGDPAVRAYYANSSLDQDFMGEMGADAVRVWVEGLLRKSKTAVGRSA